MTRIEFDLRIPCEEFVIEVAWRGEAGRMGLFGPSGAGKTSVLAALAGLRPGVKGEIRVDGETWLDSARDFRLPPERRRVGYVPQDLLLFPHLTVEENLGFSRRPRLETGGKRWTVERLARMLEIEALLGRPVGRLSGGERQRVALGRALGAGPALLLLDEPFGGLDRALRRRIHPALLRIQEETGVPTLLVTHDAAELLLLADEVLVLERGRLEAAGRVREIVAAGGHAARALAVHVLTGSVTARGESLLRLRLDGGGEVAVADPGGVAVGSRLACELDPADVLLARGEMARVSAQNVLAARVEALQGREGVDPTGGVLVLCRQEETATLWTALVSHRAARELELSPGAPVHVLFKANACRPLST